MTKRAARLLFVTSFYPPVTGGGSWRIADLSRLMASMGYQVTVLTFSPFLSLPKIRKAKEVELIRVPTLGFKHPLDQIFTSLIGTLLVIISKVPDFLIASVPMGEPCIGAFLASNLLGTKAVVDVRDEWEDVVIKRTRRFLTRNLYRLYRKLFNAFYQQSSLVTTVTPTLVKRTIQRGARTVYLIPNGADVNLFHPVPHEEQLKVRGEIGLQADDFVIVYAGRVGWYYRIDVVIEALHILINKQKLRNIKFLVMGPGEKVREYVDSCGKLGLKENAIFLAERSREEVARILPSCDVGVIPLDDDPVWLSAYTTKFFEYCASGLPVIASVPGGADLEKLINESDVGFAIEPLKPKQFAEAILKTYRDKSRRKEMQANARRLTVEKFNKEEIAHELGNILKMFCF